LSPTGISTILCNRRREKILVGWHHHERPQQFLRLGTQRNGTPIGTPLVLVPGWLINPDRAEGIDVAHPQADNLRGAHPGQPLQTDHRRHFLRNMGQDGIDPGIGHRFHWLALSGLSAAELQAGDRS
jgi:hypothetical protein